MVMRPTSATEPSTLNGHRDGQLSLIVESAGKLPLGYHWISSHNVMGIERTTARKAYSAPTDFR